MIRTLTNTLKTGLCLLAFFTISTSLIAQTTGGPDTYGYIWRDSNDPSGPTYNWVDIVNAPGAVMVTGLTDDNIRGPYPIGFTFHYYWYDVTTFRVGSNGYLGFTATPVAHPFPVIPYPFLIQDYMAIMTTDLTFVNGTVPVAGAECWYWTSPGNDSLVLSYINVPFWDAAAGFTGSNTFQVILSNVDSSITYQYASQIGALNNTTDFMTIGIENNSGAIGLQHSHNAYPPSTYAIKFYYPSATTFVVNDASTVYNNNETTGGLFLSANGAPFEMSTQIKNTGNQPLAPFNVTSRVVNFLNQNQVLSTVQSSALALGATEDITFPSTYSPVNPGVYRHINTTALAGDATPGNNEKQLELQVVDTTQTSILLSFDTGVDAGLGGLAWSGGGGGLGIEFVPPFYPCDITQVRAYIAANANLFGYYIMIMDDDGPNGAPGTILDSINITAPNVLVGAWNFVPLASPVTIDSGSFYVAWMMGGDGISLGQNQLAPFSNRTYEILGASSNPNSWAAYRYREIEDVMLNVYISDVPVGVNEISEASHLGDFYPNPNAGSTSINFNFPKSKNELLYSIFDVNGKLVMSGNHSNPGETGTLELNLSSLQNGIYNCVINTGDQLYNRKLSVIK